MHHNLDHKYTKRGTKAKIFEEKKVRTIFDPHNLLVAIGNIYHDFNDHYVSYPCIMNNIVSRYPLKT